ncbi:MAG: hypothetical protein AAGA65_07850 [Actinomycetota bacterium]
MMKRLLTSLLGIALIATACGGDADDVAAAPVIEIDGVAVTDQDDPADQTATAAADDAADTAAPAGADTTDQTDEELALEFAQCMRESGFAEFPDPAVNADGSIDLIPGGPQQFQGVDQATIDEAVESCSDIVAGASFLPGAGMDQTEIEDQLLAFAQCLRDLGHDIADPQLNGSQSGGANGPGGIFANGFDPTDPANADDIATCQVEVVGPNGVQGSN